MKRLLSFLGHIWCLGNIEGRKHQKHCSVESLGMNSFNTFRKESYGQGNLGSLLLYVYLHNKIKKKYMSGVRIYCCY